MFNVVEHGPVTEMAETPGGNQTPGKASKKLKDSKFGETIVEEVRSRYTAALSHLPDPALHTGQIGRFPSR